MKVELLGGPADGQEVTVSDDVQDLHVPVRPRPSVADFMAPPGLAPLDLQVARYERQQVVVSGPHPCIRGQQVEIRATGYVHDRYVAAGVLAPQVRSRGRRAARVVPDWSAALYEAERCAVSGTLRGLAPAHAWALQAAVRMGHADTV